MAAKTSAISADTSWIERQFKVRAAGSTVGTELRGGLTTFLVMSYILVVNAVILSAAGVPFPACVAATTAGNGMPAPDRMTALTTRM